MYRLLAAALAAALSVATPAAAANLLTNGDFANGSLNGWAASSLVYTAQDDVFGGPPDNWAAFMPQGFGYGAIEQSVTLEKLAWYTLSFDVAVLGTGSQSFNFFARDADGGRPVYFNPNVAGSLSLAGGYTRLTYLFRSPGEDVTFQFLLAGRGVGDHVSLFDNLTLEATPVPEPATWAMMVVGFGLAGALVRSARGSAHHTVKPAER